MRVKRELWRKTMALDEYGSEIDSCDEIDGFGEIDGFSEIGEREEMASREKKFQMRERESLSEYMRET